MLYKFNMMSTEYAAETEIFNLLKRTGLGWVSLGGMDRATATSRKPPSWGGFLLVTVA
jgi:hypothetical protein